MVDVITERVAAFADRHGLLPPGEIVLAMVSGGADSMALMHLLATLCPGRLHVLAVDHGLREGARREVDTVRAASDRLGVPVEVERLELASGAGVQARARDARYAAAERVAARVGAARIATGHTRSDQAETVLFRLARGTGRTGATGMAPRRGPLVRPLLAVDRDEIRAYCGALGIPFADDPSNVDERYARSRVRHGLLPLLEAIHPGATAHLAGFADRLRDEAALLDHVVDLAWNRVAVSSGLDVRALAAEPPALRRLLVRRLADATGTPLSADGVDRVLLLLSDPAPITLPGARFARVERGRIVIEAPLPPVPPDEPLPVPGRVRWGGTEITARAGMADDPQPAHVAIGHPGPFVVRGVRPGDRLDMGGWHLRCGRALADAGIPAHRRPHVPLVECAGEPVWVPGVRAAAASIAPTGRAATVLDVRWFTP